MLGQASPRQVPVRLHGSTPCLQQAERGQDGGSGNAPPGRSGRSDWSLTTTRNAGSVCATRLVSVTASASGRSHVGIRTSTSGVSACRATAQAVSAVSPTFGTLTV